MIKNTSVYGRKSICILSLSPIARDGRVLRQIQYLRPHYDLTVVGYGPPHPRWANDPQVRWVQLPEPTPVSAIKAAIRRGKFHLLYQRLPLEGVRLAYRCSLYLGRVIPTVYDYGYSLRWHVMEPVRKLLSIQHDAYHANDWNTLSLAAKMAQKYNARLVIDLHEYAPLEFESRPDWWLYEPMLRTILHKYAPLADASITVAPPIAERYRQEFGIDPLVVLNAPEYVPAPEKEMDGQNLRIVHHGAASKLRKPEVMIEAIARCDQRYSLHFMFVPSSYVEELKQIAAARAPGRVFFHPPVAPEAIVPRIAEFDIGFTLLPPQSFNDQVALPNKFFESIGAGLAVCAGPSPSMAAIIQQYACGVTAPSFDPEDIATLLNQTTVATWRAMRRNARAAAKELNAAREMNKVVQLYSRLLSEG